MPQGVNAIALAENLHSAKSLFRYHGGSWTMGIHKFQKRANKILEISRFKYIQI